MSQNRIGSVSDEELLKNQFLNMSIARADYRSTLQEAKELGPSQDTTEDVDQEQANSKCMKDSLRNWDYR